MSEKNPNDCIDELAERIRQRLQAYGVDTKYLYPIRIDMPGEIPVPRSGLITIVFGYGEKDNQNGSKIKEINTD